MTDIKIGSFEKNGVLYYQMYTRNPICVECGKETPPLFWKHNECGGDIYIGNNAHLYCEKCGALFHHSHMKIHCKSDGCCDTVFVSETNDENYYDHLIGCAGYLIKHTGLPWLKELLYNM